LNKLGLVNHYKNIFFFAIKRYEGENYKSMREYFASILVYDLKEVVDLNNKRILDVGGSNGEFSRYIGEKYDCEIINLDPNPTKPLWETIIAPADQIPFEDEKFDLIFFRGVLEHIPPILHQASLDEIYRVLRKDGVGYFVIPPWYNPHAGHGLKPFHLLPFPVAKFLRNLFFKKKVTYSSLEEASLYKVTHSKTIKMIEYSGFKLINTLDTHFRFHILTKIPIFREFLVPATAFIVKK